MTILLILAFAAFTAAMFVQAGRALWGERGEAPAAGLLREDLKLLEELVAERAMLLSALRELELDRELEKISAEDYQHLKRRYERQAVQIMRKLDELYGGRGWEQAIDEAIDARLDDDAGAAPVPVPVPLNAALPEPAPAPELAGWACPACARVMDDEDMFCGRCGAARPARATHVASEAPVDAAQEPPSERAERAQEETATR